MANRRRRKRLFFASGPQTRKRFNKVKVGGRKMRRRKLASVRTRILRRALGGVR